MFFFSFFFFLFRILGSGRSIVILGDSMNLGFYYSLWNNMLVNATSKFEEFSVSGFEVNMVCETFVQVPGFKVLILKYY